jgi:hypothetical protein
MNLALIGAQSSRHIGRVEALHRSSCSKRTMRIDRLIDPWSQCLPLFLFGLRTNTRGASLF